VLITGGAGFIGRHVARKLVSSGWDVRILDSLIEQVHGPDAAAGVKKSLTDAELLIGDVRDEDAMSRALRGVDSVIHLAAEVGVGQSMYAIDRYVSCNDLGTACLFQRLIEEPVRRVVVASSMSVYGEGLYQDEDGALVENAARRRLGGPQWDPLDAKGRPLTPLATPEWKRPNLSSVYALTKYVQEQMTLNVTAAYGMEGVALRLFNAYGPGQALQNPYTGVLAIFASRLANGKPPLIYEDGAQRRDFVHVEDVARAFELALERPEANGEVFNIASGQERTVARIAEMIAAAMDRPSLLPEITGKARSGDIRHCFADTTKAKQLLGFEAQRDFTAGLRELSEWVAGQDAQDRLVEARRELEARGLLA
jgi:dTDP-L-rhamnose 4-epimerase